MPKFMVYIPSPMPGMPNLQLKVDAENWMMALQLGRQKVGEKAELGSNIICDFKEDGSVEVTDPNTGRAFSIKELEEAPQPAPSVSQPVSTPPAPTAPVAQPIATAMSSPTAQATPKQMVAEPPKVVEPPKAVPVEAPKPTPVQKPEEKRPQPVSVSVPPTAKVEPEVKPQIQKQVIQYQPIEKTKKVDVNIEEIREVTEEKAVGRRDTKLSSNIDSIMTSLFTEVFEVYNVANTREEVANFMLDLAMKKIGVEAGSVLYADLSETELSFIAVRGPKSEEIKKFKIPIGKGIVGFCVDFGVSLAISDVSKDKRWFDKISKTIGFPTKSILCAPIQYEDQTIGAIELINKKGDNTFTVDDVNILNYIAHETGEAFVRIEGKRQQK